MALFDDLTAAISTAQKDGQNERLTTFRLLKNVIDGRVKDGLELNDDLVQSCAAAEIKKRREAAELYRQGNSLDKAAAEEAEAALLAAFAPVMLSEAELIAIVDEQIAQTKAAGPGDLGRVMAAVRQQVGQRGDLGAVSRLVRDRLAK